jgi:hypothetical protein
MVDFCEKEDVNRLIDFVNNVKATSGDDAPEAYELALRTARKKFSWTNGYSKALVMIGDEVPHPPSYTTKNINWKEEVSKLAEMGVKIYGVRALNSTHAIPFYEEMSERTGTVSIKFNNFKLIVDMFLVSIDTLEILLEIYDQRLQYCNRISNRIRFFSSKSHLCRLFVTVKLALISFKLLKKNSNLKAK